MLVKHIFSELEEERKKGGIKKNPTLTQICWIYLCDL